MTILIKLYVSRLRWEKTKVQALETSSLASTPKSMQSVPKTCEGFKGIQRVMSPDVR